MKQIRRANTEDAEQIAWLGRTTFIETFEHLFRDSEDLETYLANTSSVQKIENSLQKASNAYWIAFEDELPIGYAKLKLKSPSEFIKGHNVGQLQKIYVTKEFISKKYGKRLQDLLLAEARKAGVDEIWLSVLNGNKRAINFYEKNGFREVGYHKFSIGKETFSFRAMSKRLRRA